MCLGALYSRWSPPSGDTIKINFDASFIVQLYLSFSGVVARNAKGLIMAAGIIPHHFVANPELAEVYACVDALNLARDMEFLSVIIEGMLLSSLTRSIVCQSCNAVAHLLAHDGTDSSGPRFLIEEAPPIIEQAALQDIWWVNSPI
ncbi:hypothetical protein V6N12_066332 [Hibiscus sabdariffa]|uniref:RNase H type-1 domain-containing protein n=1 Tax=Hibiscus sabdariffa TaxID=183260 RepID=A0ABR2CPT2_9ROSI